MKKYSAQDILNAREKREQIYNLIVAKLNMAFIVVRVNYPGTEKNNELCNNIIQVMDKILSYTFANEINCKGITYGAEGPILYMVMDEDHYVLKKAAVELEEKHILGRCVDIDVYSKYGNSISRSDLGIKPRTCYICDELAHVCVRSRRHSEEEVIRFIKNKFREYKENVYGNL